MKTLLVLVALVAVIAVPAIAQGPFTDVPADHWAYDAINQLQSDGVLIGYPDGTFQGKRTLTRYEFAVALARIAETLPGGISRQDVQDMLKGYAKEGHTHGATTTNGQPIDTSKFATKADVDALRKLVDEFKDEIAALGVDVDALKRDVAALGARVDAIEAELKRVRFTGDATVIAISQNETEGVAFDLDNRTPAPGKDALARNIGLVKDFDLKIAGRVNNCVTANATINYGNYLNYVAFVDDYVGGSRPTSTTVQPTDGGTITDAFFPYYLSIDAAMGNANLTMGRFPLQFTPYTLRKIDVDSYTTILKTDDGNYPVDGAKLALAFGGVDFTLFAVKNDENAYLINGLTGQPTQGMPVMHQGISGNAVGGLTSIAQTAGGRATFGIPGNGTVGLTFYQSWDEDAYLAGLAFDQARVYGADLSIGVPFFSGVNFQGSWTQSDTLATTGVDVDYLNIAWDGKFSGSFGALNAAAGYKSIGRNFAAAGAWDKIGRWTNPVNVKGPYADFNLPILSNLKLALNGEWLTVKDDASDAGLVGWGTTRDDTLIKAEAGLKWGFTPNNAIEAAYQWVQFSPDAGDDATEQYLTVGYTHQMNPNANLRIGYQFIKYDDGATASGPYLGDYKGGLGVVQFGVSF